MYYTNYQISTMLVWLIFMSSILNVNSDGQQHGNNESVSNVSGRVFILDSALGSPISNINCTFSRKIDDHHNGHKHDDDDLIEWEDLNTELTNEFGIVNFVLEDPIGSPYKLHLNTATYYSAINATTFYPYVEVIFSRMDDDYHQVVIIANPMSYSAYRGKR